MGKMSISKQILVTVAISALANWANADSPLGDQSPKFDSAPIIQRAKEDVQNGQTHNAHDLANYVLTKEPDNQTAAEMLSEMKDYYSLATLAGPGTIPLLCQSDDLETLKCLEFIVKRAEENNREKLKGMGEVMTQTFSKHINDDSAGSRISLGKALVQMHYREALPIMVSEYSKQHSPAPEELENIVALVDFQSEEDVSIVVKAFPVPKGEGNQISKKPKKIMLKFPLFSGCDPKVLLDKLSQSKTKAALTWYSEILKYKIGTRSLTDEGIDPEIKIFVSSVDNKDIGQLFKRYLVLKTKLQRKMNQQEASAPGYAMPHQSSPCSFTNQPFCVQLCYTYTREINNAQNQMVKSQLMDNYARLLAQNGCGL